MYRKTRTTESDVRSLPIECLMMIYDLQGYVGTLRSIRILKMSDQEVQIRVTILSNENAPLN